MKDFKTSLAVNLFCSIKNFYIVLNILILDPKGWHFRQKRVHGTQPTHKKLTIGTCQFLCSFQENIHVFVNKIN